MNVVITTLFALSVVMMGVNSSFAQLGIGNRIKNKIENKVGQKAEEKLSKDDASGEGQEGNRKERNFGNLFGGSNYQLKSSYDFVHDMTMSVTSTGKNGKASKPNNIKYYIGNGGYLGMEALMEEQKGQKVFMIVDDGSMVTLTESEGSKIAMVIGFNADAIAEVSEEEGSNDQVTVKKTGRTKTILGYKCEEYVAQNEDGTSEIWIAPDLADMAGEMGKGFGAMAKQTKVSKNALVTHKGGLPLEMHYTAKNGEKTDIVTTELNRNKSTSVKTTDYQLMNIGSLPGSGNK